MIDRTVPDFVSLTEPSPISDRTVPEGFLYFRKSWSIIHYNIAYESRVIFDDVFCENLDQKKVKKVDDIIV